MLIAIVFLLALSVFLSDSALAAGDGPFAPKQRSKAVEDIAVRCFWRPRHQPPGADDRDLAHGQITGSDCDRVGVQPDTIAPAADAMDVAVGLATAHIAASDSYR